MALTPEQQALAGNLTNHQKANTKRPRGAQSTFTQEKADEVVMRVSNGEPLAPVLREMKIGVTTWYDWVNARPELAEAIARARLLGFDVIADECLEIADDARNDWMERQGDDGDAGYVLNGEHVQRSKLRIETRLKLLAKWDPKRYGDRVTTDHTSTDGSMSPKPVVVVSELTDEQLAKLVAEG